MQLRTTRSIHKALGLHQTLCISSAVTPVEGGVGVVGWIVSNPAVTAKHGLEGSRLEPETCTQVPAVERVRAVATRRAYERHNQ